MSPLNSVSSSNGSSSNGKTVAVVGALALLLIGVGKVAYNYFSRPGPQQPQQPTVDLSAKAAERIPTPPASPSSVASSNSSIASMSVPVLESLPAPAAVDPSILETDRPVAEESDVESAQEASAPAPRALTLQERAHLRAAEIMAARNKTKGGFNSTSARSHIFTNETGKNNTKDERLNIAAQR